MTDLFMSKKDQLYHWLRSQHFVKTHLIAQWGVVNYCNNALRLARKMREDGILRRLDEKEMIHYGFTKTREKVYEVVG